MWPRLRDWRRPLSRSSLATTASFVRAHASTRSRSSGAPARTRSHRAPPAISAVLITSAQPAASSGCGSVAIVAGSTRTAGRLVIGAGVVLALRQVDAGLAAVGGVDLGHERRRHLHNAHAALVEGGAEARDVADDAAAERDHVVVVVHARGGQAAQQALDARERLVLLAGRDPQLGRDAAAGGSPYSGPTASSVITKRRPPTGQKPLPTSPSPTCTG